MFVAYTKILQHIDFSIMLKENEPAINRGRPFSDGCAEQSAGYSGRSQLVLRDPQGSAGHLQAHDLEQVLVPSDIPPHSAGDIEARAGQAWLPDKVCDQGQPNAFERVLQSFL